MKTKRFLKGIALVLSMVFCFSVGVFASGNTEVIQALMNYGIVIKFDGQTQNMYNANGKQVFPISYEGTTYVPIRAVSSMLGIDVEWDGPNNTVWLGNTGTAKDFIEMEPYSGYWSQYLPQDNHPETIAGKQYSEYISTDYDDVYYNLEGKYKVLKFDAYSDSDNFSINFYGDNDELLSTIDIEGSDLPTTHKINVSNVTQLKIETKSYGYLFNMTIE